MRLTILALAAACWWTFQTHHSAPAGEAADLPAVSSNSPASATGAWALGGLWASQSERAAPPADPVVLCRIGAEADYLRTSECAQQGGSATDEPFWARVD